MHEAIVHRPLTIASLADALATKPYQILAELICRSVFPAPGDTIDDGIAQDVAAISGVVLKIIDDEDGGASGPVSDPVFPPIPPGLTNASEKTIKAEQAVASDDGSDPV